MSQTQDSSFLLLPEVALDKVFSFLSYDEIAKNRVACLSVDTSHKVMVFGDSKDFGTCKSIKKSGEKCTSVVNLNKCEFCIYHVKQEYQKCSKRSELQANFAGNGLVNLRNKVLGKNEVFYAGKSYMAIPAKKSRKLITRDNNTLQNLSGTNANNCHKTKNTKPKMKGAARHLDVNPAERARDLELLKKLGGTGSLEAKTTFSGVRSDKISLEASKATALDVISKLKAKKDEMSSQNTKSIQYDLKGDLYVNMDSKQLFSGKVSESVTLEGSKKAAQSVISKLKAKNGELPTANPVETDEGHVTLEEFEAELDYGDDEDLGTENINLTSAKASEKQSKEYVTSDVAKTKVLTPESAVKTPRSNSDGMSSILQPQAKSSDSPHSTNINVTSFSNSLNKIPLIGKSPNVTTATKSGTSLENVAMGVPILSGIGKGGFVDLSKPITPRHVDRAKLNALKFIQRNGPIKKVDPNNTKSTGSRKRNIENILVDPQKEHAAKKSKLQESDFISDRFKKMMAMTSKHADLLERRDDEEKEKYFNKLEIKEKMEDKMANTHKVKCKAVKCLKCKYTSFSASEMCKTDRHPLKVFDAMKRFYKCANCKNRTVTLELIPTRPCNSCGSSKWEKTGMMKEKIAVVQHNLSIRGGEQKFVNSVVADASLDLLVCKKFNGIGSKLLSRGFIQLEKRHAAIYRRVKSSLPRRESERKTHPLARHNEILQGVETRLSMLNMTYMRYIEHRVMCFIPGKVLDEIKSILNVVETSKSPPRPLQLLQELRDLSSMAIEHFDEHILPRCREKLEQQSGSPENILRELEVVAGSLTPFTKLQGFAYKHLASSSKQPTKILIHHQQLPNALTAELYKVKKIAKTHKHHISYLTQNTQKLCLKLRKQNNKLRIQAGKLRDQERKLQEQTAKIMEQEAALNEVKKHMEEWEHKYRDLTAELVRARDEILLKASNSSSSSQNPTALSANSNQYKSNIKPRVAHILPKHYLSVDFERKRKSLINPEVPLKRNRSPGAASCSSNQNAGKSVQDVCLDIPDLVKFETNTPREAALPSRVNAADADNDETNIRNNTLICSFFNNLLTNSPKRNVPRKRKMTEAIGVSPSEGKLIKDK